MLSAAVRLAQRLCSLLGDDKGGSFKICGVDGEQTRQLYHPDTNVLMTYFSNKDGVVLPEDFMSVDGPAAKMGSPIPPRIVRRLIGIRGTRRKRMECSPAVDYAREFHQVTRGRAGVWFISDSGRRLGLSLPIECEATPPQARHKGADMDETVRSALKIDMTIDITTTGRKSGEARRMEIWSHYFDDRLIVTGSPGRRGWYANLVEHPEFMYHLKDDLKVDLPATATPVTEESERRAILSRLRDVSPFRQEQGMDDLEAWVSGSPMVIVTIGG